MSDPLETEQRQERREMITDRIERIRDYVPAEEFDENTARIIAKQETP